MERKFRQRLIKKIADKFHREIRNECIEDTCSLADAFELEEHVIEALSMKAKR